MKLTFIGAGGVRTPLVIQSILNFQERLPLNTVCMMDVDAERLELIRLACKPRLAVGAAFDIEWTTDARHAIQDADYIVTTFRVGCMESRVIDEQVPLKYGVLGQETTGPGGFAMALRSIPALLEYVALIKELAPQAWLLNFANPAGIFTEVITRVCGFERAVGICDNPAGMLRAAADFVAAQPDRFFPEYYGINHLGWLRALYLEGRDILPEIIQQLRQSCKYLEHFPFDISEVEALGTIPNEYLYFYYHPRESVENLKKAGQSRAQQLLAFNNELYTNLRHIRDEEESSQKVEEVYQHYLNQRHSTYMTLETSQRTTQAALKKGEFADEPASSTINVSAEGYSSVALNVIEALSGSPKIMILNVPNRGALPCMAVDDVVETTCLVGNGVVRPFAINGLPEADLGLMKMVKAYERLTIQAAIEKSYHLAIKALATHPLVPSYQIAKVIVDEYISQHGDYFPRLK